MNKKIIYIILLITLLAGIAVFFITQSFNKVESLAGVENGTENTNKAESVIEIKEKMFIQQLDDIFVNLKQYEGKTVKLQGFMYNFNDEFDGNTYHYVIRKTPGCCGDDGTAGLEIEWNKEYPADNEWVEAEGIIKSVNENGMGEVPVLELTRLDVMQERGADFVTQ